MRTTLPKVRAKKSVEKKLSNTELVKRRILKKAFAGNEPMLDEVMGTKAKTSTQNKSSVEPVSETVAFVPGTISVRLQERMNAYSVWYKDHGDDLAQLVAKSAGYSFVVFGFLMTYLYLAPTTNQNLSFLTAQVCETENCDSTTTEPSTAVSTTNTEPVEDNTTTTTAQPLINPKVNFLNIPTVTVGKDTEFAISLYHAHEPRLYITSKATGEKKVVQKLLRIDGDKHIYMLPTAALPAGQYVVTVMVLADDNITRANFTSPRFEILGTTEETASETTQTNTTTSVETEPSATTEVRPVPETSQIEPGTTNDVSLAITMTKTDTTDGIIRIFVKTNDDYDAVEIYARPSNSIQKTFIGVATRVPDGWVYWLNPTSLPAGNYSIIAQARKNREILVTSDAALENKVEQADFTTTDAYQKQLIETKATLEQVARDTKTVDIVEIRKTYASSTDQLTQRPPEEAIVVPPSLELAKELMAERRDNFNELFIRHASALQTGDATMLRLAETALEDEVNNLLDDNISGSPEERAEARAELELAAKAEIEKVKRHIVKTENLLKERTSQKSAEDSDRDGISDYDEMTIYETDPNKSDTDGDGIIDSVEIMRGYNPKNSSPEAVIAFNSPKDVGYVNEEVLKVETVVPVLEYGDEEALPIVQSEISGFGLPNSFVTLYIFSTPTVVTLRTNDDGSFAYVFSKELEDGEHEVYVALTDNSGEIVVRSNPFKFIKTAQAFSYVDAANEAVTPITTAPDSEVSAPFKIAGAMGIVSLGLILLLLGQMLRVRKPEEDIIV